MMPPYPDPSNDFCTNRHSERQPTTDTCSSRASATTTATTASYRRSEFSFDDGNLAIVTETAQHEKIYSLVHQGVLFRHSPVIEKLATLESQEKFSFVEGRTALCLDDSPEEMQLFLTALYDGISSLQYDESSFPVVSSLLILFSKYDVNRLRSEALEGLNHAWPMSLELWEQRESRATDMSGVYLPRLLFPHPIMVIELAHKINVPELLPSAFYDFSRFMPSEILNGVTCPRTGKFHRLSDEDMLITLTGREYASRFFSTFILQELENRKPSENCLNGHAMIPDQRKICKLAFEAISFELLSDVNGVVRNRNSDPLFAIASVEMLHTRGFLYGTRPCDVCYTELMASLQLARESFWMTLPAWFGVGGLDERWGLS